MAVAGWFITFIAIYSTTQVALQLALAAVGVNAVVVGDTAEWTMQDEKNPVGQVVAILGALAVGLGITFLLHRWYSRRVRELNESNAPSIDSPPESSGVGP